jgi:hypothetical protein
MSVIIDIDSHFEPGSDWLAPYPELASRLPRLNPSLLAVDAIVGDLLRDVASEERPPIAELLPPGLLTLFGEEKRAEAERRAEFEGKDQFQVANAKARLTWLDRQGIALQNVICLSGFAYNLLLPELALRQEVLRTCNTWLAETCAAAGGRLLPVTALDYADLDFVTVELERMRGLGSHLPDSRVSREWRAARASELGSRVVRGDGSRNDADAAHRIRAHALRSGLGEPRG